MELRVVGADVAENLFVETAIVVWSSLEVAQSDNWRLNHAVFSGAYWESSIKKRRTLLSSAASR